MSAVIRDVATDAEETIRMCAEQGVDCVFVPTWGVDDCRRCLELLRRHRVKGFTSGGPDTSTDVRGIVAGDAPCERAVCNGGAYRGLAIDRNLFSFSSGPHEIVIEPPVYTKGQPYTRHVRGPDGAERTVKSGHYFDGLRPTGLAEIVVPERAFDSAPHVRIVPCEVLPAGPTDRPENDTACGMSGPEIEKRRLVRLRFDLSDCADCLLDKVGIAVYWESDPDGEAWKGGSGQLSVFSDITRRMARDNGRMRAARWAEANGGTFPSEDIVAIRFGDECFNITGWIDSPACSFPLWGFSESGRAAFAAAAPAAAVQPRTWGFPEIYGSASYATALYEYHKACAGLVHAFRDGAREIAPSLPVFRNTTRAGAWSEANDHDGTGQELLSRELDFIHLDPYPVNADGYANETIPCDMGYLAGFARRFGKPLLPWMQAHTYGPTGLGDITPADMRRMWRQHIPFGPDGMMWLGFDAHPGDSGYEMTFPKKSPESWAYAKQLFKEVHNAQSTMQNAEWRMQNGATNSSLFTLHSSLAAQAAIVRPYTTRAICCSTGDGRWRNPADRILEAWTLAWGVDNGLPYDVFELPPSMENAIAQKRDNPQTGDSPLDGWAATVSQLSRYPLVISTIPIPVVQGVRVVGAGTEGSVLSASDLAAMRKAFAAEIAKQGKVTRK